MLILLDQGTPVPIREFLKSHTVKTAAEQGWGTLANSELLDAQKLLDLSYCSPQIRT